MKILAIPATNSPQGINRQLLEHVASSVEGGLISEASVEIVDLDAYEMPIYSGRREQADGVPALAQDLFAKTGDSDAVVVSFAEHNGSFTAAWKNVYDWMSRIDAQVYQGKKVAMLAATPGPRAGAGVLGSATMSAPFFGADLVGSLGIPTFHQTFDPQVGALADPDLQASLDELLRSLAG